MKRFGCFLLSLTLISMAIGQIRQEFAPGVVLVRFKQASSLASAQSQVDEKVYKVERVLVQKLNIYQITILNRYTVPQAVEMLSAQGEILWAQPDHFVSERLTPNDTQFTSQWDMHQASDRDIDAPEAWDITTGGTDAAGHQIVVAVVDGGCQLTHTDLAANIWRNQAEFSGSPGVDDDGNGYVDDINGWDAYSNDGSIPSNTHGTHVSGTVGAIGNNNSMVTGVNWNVKIMEVAASSGTTSIISIGYGYVLSMKDLWWSSGGTQGANVVSTNSSFGVDAANCASGSYPIWNDLYTAMGESGILSACATANQNWNIDVTGDVPTGCSSPYIISVTNTTNMDQKNSGAGYGLTTIDLGAPGTNIISTVPTNSTSSLTGTSMATPHVAGAVGFLHAAANLSFINYYMEHPDSAALALKQILLDGTDPIAALNGITVSGGRLNLNTPAIAISQFVGPEPEGPVLEYSSHMVDDFAENNNELLDAGETANLVVTLSNNGLDATNVTAVLSTSDAYLDITDANGSFGNIAASGSANNLGDMFIISAHNDAPLEHVASLTLAISADDGYNVMRSFDLQIGQKVIYWSDEIEGGENGWTHSAVSGANDQWHISTTRSNSPTHSWKCGSTGGGDYANSMDAGLVTPEILITPESELRFMHWIESELSGAFTDSAYDGAIVEISVNGGAYSQITPDGGYPKHYRTTSGGGNPFTGPLPGAPCFAGNMDWSDDVFNLSTYAGQNVRFRFRFSSDNGGAGEGWYVDDIEISGATPQFGPPDPVDDLVIFAEDGNLNLYWSMPPSGADYFKVFRSTHFGIAPVDDLLVGTTTSTTFVDSFAAPLYDMARYQVVTVRE